MSVRMGMYEVCAKCGHVGRYNYVDKIFAVKASSGKEAAAKVRNFPRVKHDHKDAILPELLKGTESCKFYNS